MGEQITCTTTEGNQPIIKDNTGFVVINGKAVNDFDYDYDCVADAPNMPDGFNGAVTGEEGGYKNEADSGNYKIKSNSPIIADDKVIGADSEVDSNGCTVSKSGGM